MMARVSEGFKGLSTDKLGKSRLLDKADKGLMLSLKAVDMMRKTSEGNGSWQVACQELETEHVKRLQNTQLWTEKHLEETSDPSSEQKPV